MTLQEYNNVLGSNAPAPGGGSALCQVGVLACSLIEMTVNVTVSKSGFDKENGRYLLNQLENVLRAKRALYRLSNDDAAAFRKITEGFKLPKITEEDKKTRAAELQKAYHRAALIPLDVINLCRELVRIATVRIAPLLGRYIASDCTIAVDLLKAVAKNSLHNVYANTALIKDEELARSLNRQGEQAVAETEAL